MKHHFLDAIAAHMLTVSAVPIGCQSVTIKVVKTVVYQIR